MKKIFQLVFLLLLSLTGFCQYNQYNIQAWGAKGDNTQDDADYIDNTYRAAALTNGTVIWPNPKVSYKIGHTIHYFPAPTQAQCFVSTEVWGGALNVNLINYTGPIDSAVFAIKGLKSATISGINATPASGKTGVILFDVFSTILSTSSSDVTFINCGGTFISDSCVGWRFGHTNGGVSDGRDISNYHFINCRIRGNDAEWTRGSSHYQYGILNEGSNTLNFTWEGGFLNNLSRGYSNVSRAGAAENQGNSSVFFFGMGGSRNHIFVEAGAPGEYNVFGGRHELGDMMITTTLAGDNPVFNLIGVEIDSYNPVDSIMFNIKRPSMLNVIGGRIIGYNSKNFGSKMFTMGGIAGSVGLLRVEGTSIQAIGRIFNASAFYKVKLTNNSNFDSTTNVSTVWLADYNSDSATTPHLVKTNSYTSSGSSADSYTTANDGFAHSYQLTLDVLVTSGTVTGTVTYTDNATSATVTKTMYSIAATPTSTISGASNYPVISLSSVKPNTTVSISFTTGGSPAYTVFDNILRIN